MPGGLSRYATESSASINRFSTYRTSSPATYIAALCDHSDALVPGEHGVLLCVALDQRVAKIILDYAQASFERSPILRQLIANRTQDALELTTGITLEVRPASFRKLRGPTYVAVIADELAFWYTDSAFANPDVEILNAVEPGLATTGGPLILASSPHARRGVLWDVFKRHYGPDGDPLTLVAHGPSTLFNPSLPQRVVDPASGSGQDSFTCAVAHKKSDGEIIIDAVREVRPFFSPSAVIDDLVILLKSYRIWQINGDHFAGELPRELFRKHGICYEVCKSPKSDLYRDLLPLLNSGRIVLPRNDRLVTQIVGLERRVTRAGKDSIDHAPNGHDDVANCVAGVAAVLHSRTYYNIAALAS